jgi:RNA polymerase sigma-70 factor (ECF subfamily)
MWDSCGAARLVLPAVHGRGQGPEGRSRIGRIADWRAGCERLIIESDSSSPSDAGNPGTHRIGSILLHPRSSAHDRVPEPPSGDAEDLNRVLDAARAGDERAFTVLYRSLTPGLLRYVRVLAGNDAEDVVAEAWLQITRDMNRFTGDIDAFRAWTATIARNRALDELRRASCRPKQSLLGPDEVTDRPAGDDVAQAALSRLDTDRALALIASLAIDQAEAVLLRVLIGLDAEAAGAVLGKRAGAVRTAAHRGLTRLRALLVDRDAAPVALGVTQIEAPALRTVR